VRVWIVQRSTYYFADACAGPGGFTGTVDTICIVVIERAPTQTFSNACPIERAYCAEYMLWRQRQRGIPTRGFGFTLRVHDVFSGFGHTAPPLTRATFAALSCVMLQAENDWALHKFRPPPPPGVFRVDYGVDGTGTAMCLL